MPLNSYSPKQTAMQFLHACIASKSKNEILQLVSEDIYWMGTKQKRAHGKTAFKAILNMPWYNQLPTCDIVYHSLVENLHPPAYATVCTEFTVLWETRDGAAKHATFGCTMLLQQTAQGWLVCLVSYCYAENDQYTSESLPIGICHIAPTQTDSILYANAFFYQLFGYTLEDGGAKKLNTLEDIVHPKDINEVKTALKSIIYFKQQNTSFEFRAKTQNHKTIWLYAKCSYDNSNTLTLVLLDITKRRLQEDATHMREEEFRLALQQHTEKLIVRYDIAEKTLTQSEYYANQMHQPAIIYNVPQSVIAGKFIAEESKSDYKAFFDAIHRGESNGYCVISTKNHKGGYSWYHADYSLIYNEDHEPVRAIISYEDITSEREKEMAYKKWKNYNETQLADCLAYYEYNLTKNQFERIEGPLAERLPQYARKSFTSVVLYSAQYFVCSEWKEQYVQFFNREELLAQYYSGENTFWFEHKRFDLNGNSIWAKATVQLLPEAYTNDVKGFVLIKDINTQKQINLDQQIKTRFDFMSGALNRASLLTEIENLLNLNLENVKHALVLLDVDSLFKLNNRYGYFAGDAILKETVHHLQTILPSNSFIGRIGADEFIICIPNITTVNLLEETIALLTSSLTIEATLEKNTITATCSMGIVIWPQDGQIYTTLYRKALIALSEAKKLGGNRIIAFNAPFEDALPIHPLQYGYDVALRFAYDALLLCNVKQDTYHIIFNNLPEFLNTILQPLFQDTLELLSAQMLHPDDRVLFWHCYNSLAKQDIINTDFEHRTIEIRLLISKQTYNWFQLVLVAQNIRGTDFSLCCFITNIHQKKKTEELQQQLQLEASRYRIIVEQTGTLVLEWNGETDSYYTSPQAKDFTFYANAEKNKNQSFLTAYDVHKEDWEIAKTFLQSISCGNDSDSSTFRLKKTNRKYIWCKLVLTTLRNKAGIVNRSMITINDVDEAIKDRKSLQYRAEYDSLTGYINFERFKIDVAKLLQERGDEKYAVWYCDIKNFKFVNDIYGYDTGDAVLQKWATILAQGTTEGEACARISADHFAVLCKYEKTEDLIRRFRKLASQLWDFKELTDKKFRLELVTGMYCVEKEDEASSIADMINRANIAHKSVKQIAGSRYAFYTKAMRDNVIHEKAIEADMPNALINHEFCFYLQPQVDIQNGNIITGAEALVRWNKSDGSIVPPIAFIPLFEKNGFIVELDLFVFQEVCKYIAKRRTVGLDLFKISVNVSRISVFQSDFAKKYIEIKKKYKIPDYLLQLECTETTVVDNLKSLDTIMTTMQQNGFLFALDDFGAGYSSLNMLKDVDADELKLDMVFVHSGLHNMKETAIVSSVISMAQKIGMKTVAEGVETRTQLHALQALNCDIVQGYLFGKPLPIAEFEELFDGSPNHDTFVE